MWVPCGYCERHTWELLHTPVCPISGSPCVVHETHTRGSFMGPKEFCYLGLPSWQPKWATVSWLLLPNLHRISSYSHTKNYNRVLHVYQCTIHSRPVSVRYRCEAVGVRPFKHQSWCIVSRPHGYEKSNDNKTTLEAVSIRKTVLPGMVIPMLKIRRPNGRLIFNMEIAIRR